MERKRTRTGSWSRFTSLLPALSEMITLARLYDLASCLSFESRIWLFWEQFVRSCVCGGLANTSIFKPSRPQAPSSHLAPRNVQFHPGRSAAANFISSFLCRRYRVCRFFFWTDPKKKVGIFFLCASTRVPGLRLQPRWWTR
jgi:hypothetical protein